MRNARVTRVPEKDAVGLSGENDRLLFIAAAACRDGYKNGISLTFI